MRLMKLRTAAAAITLVATLSACSGFAPDSSPLPTERETESGPGQSGGGEAQAGRRIDDLGPLGSAARPLLQAEPFTRISLEIAFMPGHAPSNEAKSHVTSVLAEVTRKDVDVNVSQIAQGDGSYAADEILAMSRRRATQSSAPVASIWVAYLDGGFEGSDDALGVALSATVAAIFSERMDSLLPVMSRSQIEGSVLLHEIGHLLALVNMGYQSRIDHEDPDHPHHSRSRGSVMYWAVESLSVANIFRGGPPDDFDEADRADLEMLAGR